MKSEPARWIIQALIRDYLKQTPRYDIFVLTTVDRDYYRKKGFLLAPGSAIEEENVFCYIPGDKKVFFNNNFFDLCDYQYNKEYVLYNEKKFIMKAPRNRQIVNTPLPLGMHVLRGVYFEYNLQTRQVENVSYRLDTINNTLRRVDIKQLKKLKVK